MKAVAIIRNRGQLTIPDAIRKIARWSNTSSVVSISIEKPSEITITPHMMSSELEWDELRKLIKKSREFEGRGRGKAGEFIKQQREY